MTVIRSIPAISITVKKTDMGFQTSTPIVISTAFPVSTVTNIIQGGGGRFDTLNDVVEGTAPVSGDVPVYNATNDKYEVKRLDFDDLTGDVNDVDGGSF